jgi:hypothetical protein
MGHAAFDRLTPTAVESLIHDHRFVIAGSSSAREINMLQCWAQGMLFRSCNGGTAAGGTRALRGLFCGSADRVFTRAKIQAAH